MSDDIAALLREIRDNQRDALQLQREHVALYLKQLDRVDRINGRAEAIQARASSLIRIILYVAVPMLVLLIVAMSWPYLRYFTYLLTHR